MRDSRMATRSTSSSDVEMSNGSAESSPTNQHQQMPQTSSRNLNPNPTSGVRRSTRTRSTSNTQEPSSSSRRLNPSLDHPHHHQQHQGSSSSSASSSSIIVPIRPPQQPPSPSNASTSQSNDSDDDDDDDEDEKDEKRNRRGHFADGFDEIDQDESNNDLGLSSGGIGSRTRAATLTQRAMISNGGIQKGRGKAVIGPSNSGDITAMASQAGSSGPKHHPKPILPRPRSLVGHSPHLSTAGSLTISSPTATPSEITWIAAQEEAEGSRSPIFKRNAFSTSMDLADADHLKAQIQPSSLPPEILLNIFKFMIAHPPDLRSCLIVCKAWCLCGVELLWHRPAFFKLDSLLNVVHILTSPDQTFVYGNFIRRLNFSALHNDLKDSIFEKMSVCVRLERLTLAGCKLVTDATLIKVLSKTPQLVAIDLTDVLLLTDATLQVLAEHCPRLQGINLSGCVNVTSVGVSALARACPLLRRVKLCHCRQVDDEAILVLTEHCPQLLEVDLINCPLITDRSVSQIWIKSYQMRELRLASCVEISNSAFPETPFPGTRNPRPPAAAVAARARADGTAMDVASSSTKGSGFNSLESSSISAPVSRGHSPSNGSITTGREPNSDPTILASSLAHSKSIDDRHWGSSNQDDQEEYDSSNPLLSSTSAHFNPPHIFDHLRILDLTSCSLLTDSAVAGLIASVPKIRNLILAKCNKLTDDAVYSIAKLGKGLHFLHLGHVLNITDKAVTHLARSCTRLRYIDLACCTNLTDMSVFELATNLPKLRRIGLVRVNNLTDQAIFSLVERYTTLERIHLSYCENVTVPAIFWLLQRLTRLTHLSLTGVPAFRKSELQKMCRQPPKDFNQHQRAAFCVYSGKGVHELRKFLQQHYSEERRLTASTSGSVAGDESMTTIRASESIATIRANGGNENATNALHPFGPLPPHVQELLANHAQSSENHSSSSRNRSRPSASSSGSRSHIVPGSSSGGSRTCRGTGHQQQQHPQQPAYNTSSHVAMQPTTTSDAAATAGDTDAVMTPVTFDNRRNLSSADDGQTSNYFSSRRNDSQPSGFTSSSANRASNFTPTSSQPQSRTTSQLEDLATPPIHGAASAQSQIEAAQLQYWHQLGQGSGSSAGGNVRRD